MLRPVSNPPNPFRSSEIEYLEEIPQASLEVYEDHTREILAHNDSPDVGFEWSVNPYRGCQHACSYCVSGDTRVLMGDGSTRAIRHLRVGDEVYGTVIRGAYRRYTRTRVLDHWSTLKPAVRITLEDGTALVASPDHRFLSTRGWRFVSRTNANHALHGTGAFADPPNHSDAYKDGYICGVVRGDGLLRGAEVRTRFEQWQPIVGVRAQAGGGNRVVLRGLSSPCEWPQNPHRDWSKGFLAGIFDAEGSYSQVIRISNTNAGIIAQISAALERFDFKSVIEGEPRGPGNRAATVRIRGGLREALRFFHTTDPAITRKRDIEGVAIKHHLEVKSVESLGMVLPMFDITTGTGDFIAEGIVSHNCFARPSHEYLGLGAGSDFDTKITVKPEAPRLLREAFEKRSWKGDLVVFSGVTDCYQPLEASYRLTRGCLEVCLEYKNPVGIITKAALIERDVELLVALSKVTRVGVSVSIPFWNKEHARLVEPYVPSPQRRIQTVQRLAEAGLAVSVMVAPVIPGLTDSDLVRILEAAKAAGARRAGYVFLRLPGSVAPVFEKRLREALPLRADRVMARVREARGGNLYDPRFGTRQVGQGNYAQMIAELFAQTVKRLGLDEERYAPVESTFARPGRGRQLPLL